MTKTGVFSLITGLFHVLHALFSIMFRNYFQVFDEVLSFENKKVIFPKTVHSPTFSYFPFVWKPWMNFNTFIMAVLPVNLSKIPMCISRDWPQILGKFSRLILYHLINQPSIRDCGPPTWLCNMWKFGKLSLEMYLTTTKKNLKLGLNIHKTSSLMHGVGGIRVPRWR